MNQNFIIEKDSTGERTFVNACVLGHDGLRHFFRVAEIIDPHEVNPGLIIMQPLAISAVEQIVAQIRGRSRRNPTLT